MNDCGLVSISPLRDIFISHSQRTVQYSKQKYGPVQTSEILDFFDGNNIMKQRIAILEKSNCFWILGLILAQC